MQVWSYCKKKKKSQKHPMLTFLSHSHRQSISQCEQQQQQLEWGGESRLAANASLIKGRRTPDVVDKRERRQTGASRAASRRRPAASAAPSVKTQQQQRGSWKCVCVAAEEINSPSFPKKLKKRKKEIHACLTILQLQHVNPSAAAALKRKNRSQNLSHTHTPVQLLLEGRENFNA